MESLLASSDFFVSSKMKALVSLLLSYPPDLLMKESSGRQTCYPILMLQPLLHTFKCALGNGRVPLFQRS